MTKYIDNTKKKEKEKKTVFNKIVLFKEIINTEHKPEEYEYVEFIGHDDIYGDEFHAWYEDKSKSKGYTIYFGEKGDEFE